MTKHTNNVKTFKGFQDNGSFVAYKPTGLSSATHFLHETGEVFSMKTGSQAAKCQDASLNAFSNGQKAPGGHAGYVCAM